MEPVTYLTRSSLKLRWPQPLVRVLNPALHNAEGSVEELEGYDPPEIRARIYQEGETSEFGPPPDPGSTRATYLGRGLFRFERGIPTRGIGKSVLVVWASYNSADLSRPRLIDTTSIEITVY